eukprot:7512651-Alexandrium_andersonii.AAC.1
MSASLVGSEMCIRDSSNTMARARSRRSRSKATTQAEQRHRAGTAQPHPRATDMQIHRFSAQTGRFDTRHAAPL